MLKLGRTKKEQVQIGEHNVMLEGVAVADHRACSAVAGLGTTDSFQDEEAEEVGEDLPFHPSGETAGTIAVARTVDSP